MICENTDLGKKSGSLSMWSSLRVLVEDSNDLHTLTKELSLVRNLYPSSDFTFSDNIHRTEEM